LPGDQNVIGIRSATIKAVKNVKSIGIIGGGRTIRDGYYKKTLGIKAVQRVAQPLSILVERGETNTQAVHDAVSRIIKPLKNCDSILLACTHYPVLSTVISEYTDANLIDPVNELYKSIKKELNRNLRGETIFMTTGDTKLMKLAARNAFQVTIPKIKKVTF
jgi:glutamate racemase